MSSHHFMVTRSPNHWWPSSWAAMKIHAYSRSFAARLASSSIDVSVNVMRPTFSIAPNPTVTGIVSMSIFSYGYGEPKNSSSRSISFAVVFAAHAASGARSFIVMMRTGVPRAVLPPSTTSNGPTPNAIR